MKKQFCVKCGTAFETDKKMARYCPDCEAKAKAEAKAKVAQAQKARAESLGLVNFTGYKADRATLKNWAEANNKIIADAVQAATALLVAAGNDIPAALKKLAEPEPARVKSAAPKKESVPKKATKK